MIIGPDFVWLHFPKCAGTAVEAALRILLGRRSDIQFDELSSPTADWHQPLHVRQRHDPSFCLGNRRVICGFRRLPSWLLSRIHYEVGRTNGRIPTRTMLLKGDFYEQNGKVNNADKYLEYYTNPRVDKWVRTEHLAEDLSAAFGLNRSAVDEALTICNETVIAYIKSISFWFTDEDLCALYEANPRWASLEQELYGTLFASCDTCAEPREDRPLIGSVA